MENNNTTAYSVITAKLTDKVAEKFEEYKAIGLPSKFIVERAIMHFSSVLAARDIETLKMETQKTGIMSQYIIGGTSYKLRLKQSVYNLAVNCAAQLDGNTTAVINACLSSYFAALDPFYHLL